MKKTLIAFAALSAIAGVAQAQSTVTIYGLLDANVGSYKNNELSTTGTGATAVTSIQSRRQNRIESGGLNGSRWGIRVREDLGAGLAAIGNLESGVNLDQGSSGQGGLLFGRRANVGLTGGFGTVTIGRNSSSYDDVSADNAMMGQTLFDPSATNNGISATAAQTLATAVTPANALPFINRGFTAPTTWIGFQTRFNNSIKYISPNFAGFTFSGMYAMGEDKTATVDASRSYSANVKYANGPLVISGGLQSESAGPTLTGTGVSTVTAGGARPALENALISAAFDLGVVKLGAGVNRAKFKDVTFPAAAGGLEIDPQTEVNLSIAVPLGATTLSAGYAQSKGDTLGKAKGFGVQALYALSKRTTLYTGLVSTEAYDRLVDAVEAVSPTSNIGKVQNFAVGVRHTF